MFVQRALNDIYKLRKAREFELKQLKTSRPHKRTIYVNQFKIDFPLQRFYSRFDTPLKSSTYSSGTFGTMLPFDTSYFIVTTPFKIVIRDTHSKVEDECGKRWPQLMKAYEYSMEDLKQLQAMKALIYKSVNHIDRHNILMYFYEKSFIYPYKVDKVKDFCWVQIKEVDCKNWNDQPHLELECVLIFDLNLYFRQLYHDNFMFFKYDNLFTQRIIEIFFRNSMPSILYYMNKFQTDEMINKFFEYDLHHKNSMFLKRIEVRFGIQQLWKYRKMIEFKNKILRIEISNVYEGMFERLWKHKGKITFGLLMLSNKKKKPQIKEDTIYRNGHNKSDWEKRIKQIEIEREK